MSLLLPINQNYDAVASRMWQPCKSPPLEPRLHQEPRRCHSSSLTSADPLSLYLLTSLSLSLSIYPRLIPSARIINGDYLNLNLLIAPPLFIMSLCSRWSRWQPESLPSLLQFSIPPLILACFISVIIHNTGTPAVKSLSLSLCLSFGSGCSDDSTPAWWRRLCLDGWHFQPMVICGRLWGGEKKCLREKHVCGWPIWPLLIRHHNNVTC